MVQIGFVTGSVGAALLNLPDRIEPRWLIAGSAVAAGATNLGLLRPAAAGRRPAAGTVAMLRLRRLPAARGLANGKR